MIDPLVQRNPKTDRFFLFWVSFRLRKKMRDSRIGKLAIDEAKDEAKAATWDIACYVALNEERFFGKGGEP